DGLDEHPAAAAAGVLLSIPAKVPAADAHSTYQPVAGQLEVAERAPEVPRDVNALRGPLGEDAEGHPPVHARPLAVVKAEDDREAQRPAAELVAVPDDAEVGVQTEHLGIRHPDAPVVGLTSDAEGIDGARPGDVPPRSRDPLLRGGG